MAIDIHAHFLPQASLRALARDSAAFPSVDLIEGKDSYRLVFADKTPTRPIMAKLGDPAPRLEFMAREGLGLQLAGGWLDAFGYEIPAEEGAAWSRFLNQGMIEAASAVAGLKPLATVPMQDGRLAAEVLEGRLVPPEDRTRLRHNRCDAHSTRAARGERSARADISHGTMLFATRRSPYAARE